MTARVLKVVGGGLRERFRLILDRLDSGLDCSFALVEELRRETC